MNRESGNVFFHCKSRISNSCAEITIGNNKTCIKAGEATQITLPVGKHMANICMKNGIEGDTKSTDLTIPIDRLNQEIHIDISIDEKSGKVEFRKLNEDNLINSKGDRDITGKIVYNPYPDNYGNSFVPQMNNPSAVLSNNVLSQQIVKTKENHMKKVLVILSVGLFILGIIFMIFAFSKKNVYKNSDYYSIT